MEFTIGVEIRMKRLVQFVRSTVIGGFFVLVPIGILVVILVRTIDLVRAVIKPIVDLLPFQSIGGISIAFLIALLLLVVLCFLAGLIAELAFAKRLLHQIEAIVLSRIPGYSLMKSVGESFAGIEGDQIRKTVLVHFSDSAQVGFQIQTLPDGRILVYIPDVPSAVSGKLHVVPSDRVEVLSITILAAIDSLGRLGIGLEKAWNKTGGAPASMTAVG